MGALLLALLLPLVGAGCTAEISSVEAHRLVASGARLLDVRAPFEFADGHAPGAINIPVEQLGRRLGELGDKRQALVVYCHTGVRAKMAVRTLRQAGFTSVHNLATLTRWYRDPERNASGFF